MSVRNLHALLQPRSIAVFGASERPGSLGEALMRNLLAGGFGGPIWPVNPRHATVMGLPCAARAADLPEAPDLAVIVAPARVVARTIGALGRRGGRIALTLTPGLGPEALAAALAAARPHLLRIIGPDSLGLLVPGLGVNASLAHLPAAPGGLALIAQSAAIAATLIDWAAEHGVGFSHVVDLGDMADVDAGDYLDLLAGDGRTRAVLLQLEEAAPARKLLSAARAAARIKPVIALLTRAARPAPGPEASLPERLLGADLAADAALRRAGVLRVRALAELFAAAEAVARFRPSERARAAIVSNGTGAARLVAEGLAEAGGALAAAAPGRPNPRDLGGAATPEDYVAALAAAAADPEVDVVLAVNAPFGVADGEAAAAAIAAEAAKGRFAGKPLLACWLGGAAARAARGALRAAGAPAFDDPAAAGRAVAHLAAWGQAQAALLRVPDRAAEGALGPAPDAGRAEAGATLRRAAAAGRARLDPEETRALLGAYGIALDGGAAGDPLAREVMIGMARDPDFGPVLLFGPGGIGAGLLCAPAAELPPLDAALASGLVARSAAAGLLGAFPDRPAADAAALLRALVGLSHMVEDLPALRAVAIDPLRVGAAGATAAAARVDFDPADLDRPAPNPDLAIRPYPAAWKRTVELKGGRYAIRPILPIDVLLYPDFLGRLDPEDVRMRFMAPRKHFPDEMGLRLTQLDYDRDMAFVAIAPDGALAGVSRLSSDPDRETAEYALVVRSDLAGRGLGTALMRQLIDYATADGIGRLEGMVLAENRGMRGLIGRLGFRIEPMPEEPGVVMSRLDLRPAAGTGP